MNEHNFRPDFCFSSFPVIMLIANKKKGVRKESEKEKTRCVCVEKKRIEIEKEKKKADIERRSAGKKNKKKLNQTSI